MWFLWVMGAILTFGTIVSIGRKLKICKLGFHEKIRIDSEGQYLNCNEYIKLQMDKHPTFGKSHIHSTFIFSEIYPNGNNIDAPNPRYVYDSVCIKCEKCFLKIEDEKEMISLYVDEYADNLRKEKIKKMMANDLYKYCKKSS